jgi:hypothetical protein
VFRAAAFAASGFAAAPGAVATGVTSEKPEAKQQKGYQLTPHVIEYYKSIAN